MFQKLHEHIKEVLWWSFGPLILLSSLVSTLLSQLETIITETFGSGFVVLYTVNEAKVLPCVTGMVVFCDTQGRVREGI